MSASSRSSRSACAFSSSRFCSSSPMRACSSCVWVCPPGAGGEVGTGERSTGERKPEEERKKRERERQVILCVRQESSRRKRGGLGRSPPLAEPQQDLFKGRGQAAATLPKPAPGWGDNGHPGPSVTPPPTPHVALPLPAPGEEPRLLPTSHQGAESPFPHRYLHPGNPQDGWLSK